MIDNNELERIINQIDENFEKGVMHLNFEVGEIESQELKTNDCSGNSPCRIPNFEEGLDRR